MTTWIEPPPKQKGMGCLGKGCLLLVVFLILLGAAFLIGGYAGVRYVVTSTTPRELPQVETSETEQQAVRQHWDEFEASSRVQPTAIPVQPTPAGEQPTPGAEQTPTPANPNKIELTAGDINQLIAASRNLHGKGFVSIDNDVAHVQVSIPLEKFGFRGRYFNGDIAVRASPDGNPRNLQITPMSSSAMSDQFLKALLGPRSVRSYVEEFANEHGVSRVTIENNKVVLEANRPR
jgi:hypothetical protein